MLRNTLIITDAQSVSCHVTMNPTVWRALTIYFCYKGAPYFSISFVSASKGMFICPSPSPPKKTRINAAIHLVPRVHLSRQIYYVWCFACTAFSLARAPHTCTVSSYMICVEILYNQARMLATKFLTR